MQYALGTIPGVTGPDESPTIDDLLELNKSIHDTLDNAMMNQIFLKEKLTTALSASVIQGPTGATGEPGTAATIDIDQPTIRVPFSEQPYVINIGTSNNAILRFGIPEGTPGTMGSTGATGAQGEKGNTGATGTCECPCISRGEQVTNGGMELFTGNIPNGWTTTTTNEVSSVTASGRVHSGSSAVNLKNNAILSQKISSVSGGCFYELSFFAHGEGSNVSFNATVTFITPFGDVPGAIITVRQQDISNSDRSFSYYRITTVKAPVDSSAAVISFSVTSNGNQSLDLDDVSFKVD